MKAALSGLALALALSLCATAAFAGDPQPPPADMGAMDHSKMQMAEMSPAEHKKMMDAKFAEIDTDKNGCLSKEEFDKHHEMMKMKHMEMMKAKEKEGHDHAETHK